MQGITNIFSISGPIISAPVSQPQNQGQLGGLSASRQITPDAIRNLMLQQMSSDATANPAPISSFSLQSVTPEQSAGPRSKLQNSGTNAGRSYFARRSALKSLHCVTRQQNTTTK